MTGIYTQFAEASSGSSNILSSLGIDWKMLLFQVIAFLILVALMGKFVYPTLIKTLDERQAKIEAGTKAATEAEAMAKKAEAEIHKTLKKAQADAAEIITTARDEATQAITKAQDKAKSDAAHIVANAHDQIEKDVISARRALENDTLELVAQATEKIIGKTVSKTIDTTLIKQSLKEVK